MAGGEWAGVPVEGGVLGRWRSFRDSSVVPFLAAPRVSAYVLPATFVVVTFLVYWFAGPQNTIFTNHVNQANSLLRGHLRMFIGAGPPAGLPHSATGAGSVDSLSPSAWQGTDGIPDRGDWDLSRHSEYSGKDLSFTDPVSKENFTPMVIETTMGVDRTCLALLVNVYEEEDRSLIHSAEPTRPY